MAIFKHILHIHFLLTSHRRSMTIIVHWMMIGKSFGPILLESDWSAQAAQVMFIHATHVYLLDWSVI